MMQTAWAVVHDGQIRLSEPIALPEGATVLVTVLGDTEQESWQGACEKSLAAVWDNSEDDIYADLLAE